MPRMKDDEWAECQITENGAENRGQRVQDRNPTQESRTEFSSRQYTSVHHSSDILLLFRYAGPR
jgi:hypothetical protein